MSEDVEAIKANDDEVEAIKANEDEDITLLKGCMCIFNVVNRRQIYHKCHK